MTERRSVDEGNWKIHFGASLVAVSSLVILLFGSWGVALMGLGMAAWIATHPYLRREWYRIGYNDGYLDATTKIPDSRLPRDG